MDILILESSEEAGLHVKEYLRMVLSGSSSIESTSDPHDAIDKIHRSDPEPAVLIAHYDSESPRAEVLAVYATVKRIWPDIRFLFLATHAPPPDLRGKDACIQLPFLPLQLSNAVIQLRGS